MLDVVKAHKVGSLPLKLRSQPNTVTPFTKGKGPCLESPDNASNLDDQVESPSPASTATIKLPSEHFYFHANGTVPSNALSHGYPLGLCVLMRTPSR